MTREPKDRHALRVVPRLMDTDLAAEYCSVSPKTITRLINAGKLSVVKLPVSRSVHHDTSRSVLVDRVELDELIPTWREKKGA